MDKTELGYRLRQARLSKGYTQQALAKLAGLGNVYLGEIERGQKMPSLNSFIKIIEALHISADYILRDALSSGQTYVCDDITRKLQNLTPRQRKTAADLLDAYLKNID